MAILIDSTVKILDLTRINQYSNKALPRTDFNLEESAECFTVYKSSKNIKIKFMKMSPCGEFVILALKNTLKIILMENGFTQTIEFGQDKEILQMLMPEKSKNIFDIVCKQTEISDGEISIHRV